MSDTTDLTIIKSRRKRTTLIPTRRNAGRPPETPLELAARIVAHFNPTGSILDPCCGGPDRSVYLPQCPGDDKQWCSIGGERDFYTTDFGGRIFDWCITTPPFAHYRPIMDRAMQVANNVVLLCPIPSVFMTARLRDMDDAGFGIREIVRVEHPSRSTGWPESGFALGAVYVQRGYAGDIKWGRLS